MIVNSSNKFHLLWTVLILIGFGSCWCQARNETNFFINETDTFINETNTFINETDTFINETNTFINETDTFINETNTFINETNTFINETMTFINEINTSSNETNTSGNKTNSSSEKDKVTTNQNGKSSPEREARPKKTRHVPKINLFLVTLPCILLFSFVFASYICIQRQQRLHGWIVLAITGSLALRFGVIFFFDLSYLFFKWQPRLYLPELCIFSGVMHHLSFLMCYCWSLVLAFDLMRRVRTVTELKGGDNKELARFGAYCAFGFGLPVFNIIVAAILEWGVSNSAGVLKPDYGKRCRVGTAANLYLITIPSGILVALNFACLSAGIWFLWKAKRVSAGAATGESGGGAIQKNLAGLVVKIFVLMGGLIIADFAIHHTGIYKTNPYLQVPIEFLCRVGYASGFVWVFIFGGTAKDQLRRKFPGSFGLVFDTWDGGRKKQKGYSMTQTSSVAHMTAI